MVFFIYLFFKSLLLTVKSLHLCWIFHKCHHFFDIYQEWEMSFANSAGKVCHDPPPLWSPPSVCSATALPSTWGLCLLSVWSISRRPRTSQVHTAGLLPQTIINKRHQANAQYKLITVGIVTSMSYVSIYTNVLHLELTYTYDKDPKKRKGERVGEKEKEKAEVGPGSKSEEKSIKFLI